MKAAVMGHGINIGFCQIHCVAFGHRVTEICILGQSYLMPTNLRGSIYVIKLYLNSTKIGVQCALTFWQKVPCGL